MQQENKSKQMSLPKNLELFWQEGFFSKIQTTTSIHKKLKSLGINTDKDALRTAITRSKFLRRDKTKKGLNVIQKFPSVIQQRGTKLKYDNLFPKLLESKLSRYVSTELMDLKINFHTSGNCTAFIFRKMLEKLIILVFRKNRIDSKLMQQSNPLKYLGLEKMINICGVQKIGNETVFTPKVAEKISGIKFLGDTAAHNTFINVDISTIIPQLPFLVVAFQELGRFL